MKYIKLPHEQVPSSYSVFMELLKARSSYKHVSRYSYRPNENFFLSFLLLTSSTNFFTTVKPSRDYNKWYM